MFGFQGQTDFSELTSALCFYIFIKIKKENNLRSRRQSVWQGNGKGDWIKKKGNGGRRKGRGEMLQ